MAAPASSLHEPLSYMPIPDSDSDVSGGARFAGYACRRCLENKDESATYICRNDQCGSTTCFDCLKQQKIKDRDICLFCHYILTVADRLKLRGLDAYFQPLDGRDTPSDYSHEIFHDDEHEIFERLIDGEDIEECLNQQVATIDTVSDVACRKMLSHAFWALKM